MCYGVLLRVAAIVSLPAALSACRAPPPPARELPVSRVLIVGIDGAAPQVVDAMLANGRLKNLRSIAERGVYGPFKSERSPLSPRVWTTMATGKTPEKHGIYGWVKASTSGNATTELFYSSDRKGLALWNILSDAGKSVTVVNWLITYPPEKIRGVMISDHTIARQLRAKEYIGEVFAQAQGQTLDNVKGPHNAARAVYPEQWYQRALAPRRANAVLTDVATHSSTQPPTMDFEGFIPT